jgi:hypothetical protein
MRSLVFIALLALLPAAFTAIGRRVAHSAAPPGRAEPSSHPLTGIERCEDVRVLVGGESPLIKVRTPDGEARGGRIPPTSNDASRDGFGRCACR